MQPVEGQHRPDRRYKEARARLSSLGMAGPVQQKMDDGGKTDEDGFGYVIITDKNEEGEDCVYTTTNPTLIHEYCDRLEAQRDSN